MQAFIREVTGCGELADKTDCSCNVYAKGGHLLCHDDVIGTRRCVSVCCVAKPQHDSVLRPHLQRLTYNALPRVSWIIYLTDPEDPWEAKDGGALELYPLEQGEAERMHA